MWYLPYKEVSLTNHGSKDRQVRGPIDPNRSEIFKIFLVRGFLKFYRSWTELILDFVNFTGPGGAVLDFAGPVL